MDIYTYTKDQLEDAMDQAKALTLSELVREGALTPEWADDWAGKHGFVVRDKGIWRTISDKWSKSPSGNFALIVTAKR